MNNSRLHLCGLYYSQVRLCKNVLIQNELFDEELKGSSKIGNVISLKIADCGIMPTDWIKKRNGCDKSLTSPWKDTQIQCA